MNTVRYVQGEHLSSVSPFAFVSRQEAPYPAAASGRWLPRRRSARSTCKVSTFIWLFCALALLLFFIVLVAPLCTQASGKARQKLNERESRLYWLLSFQVLSHFLQRKEADRSAHFLTSRPGRISVQLLKYVLKKLLA
jgi:hypothetical protein